MSDHVTDILEQWRARRPDLDLTGMAVFGRVSRLTRLIALRQADVLASADLEASDVDVLAALWRKDGPLRPKDLRRSMMVGSGTLTGRLDRLEAAGLLERRPDPDDRRGRLLHLTAAGASLLPEIVERLLRIENELLSALPADVRERLAADLGLLLAAAEPQRG